jgi:hypothetical protein
MLSLSPHRHAEIQYAKDYIGTSGILVVEIPGDDHTKELIKIRCKKIAGAKDTGENSTPGSHFTGIHKPYRNSNSQNLMRVPILFFNYPKKN